MCFKADYVVFRKPDLINLEKPMSSRKDGHLAKDRLPMRIRLHDTCGQGSVPDACEERTHATSSVGANTSGILLSSLRRQFLRSG